MNKLLTALFISTIALTACSNASHQQKPDNTATTAGVNDTASLIKAAKQESKQVTSYTSSYRNDIQEGNEQSVIDFSLMKDAQNNQKVTIQDNKENIVFYVYNKKTILKQDDQWIDASTYVGTQMISQTEPLLYDAQFKLIDQLKDAKYEKNNGYTLTETFNDYKKYQALFGNTKENRKVIAELEKKYPKITGSITVKFKENKQLDTITNKLSLKNSRTTVTNDAVTAFSKINTLKKLDVPDAVKKAESIQ